ALLSLAGCNRERPAPTPTGPAATIKVGTATPTPPGASVTKVVLPGQTPQAGVAAATPTIPSSSPPPTPVPIATSAAPTPPIQPASATGETIHVVERGETLAKIAARYGVTAQQIADLNGITNPNLIYAGQKLRIPAAAPAVTEQPRATRTYTVRAGDTLVGIATKFGVTVQAIQQLNNLPSPDKIYTGQVLKIP
ncbi:MAG: LysM peptidoglycan-binding domain-containing protein, partial [Anaerolineae bacterium]